MRILTEDYIYQNFEQALTRDILKPFDNLSPSNKEAYYRMKFKALKVEK